VEVLEGLYLIRGEVSNIYLVRASGGYVLIDAGTPATHLGCSPTSRSWAVLSCCLWVRFISSDSVYCIGVSYFGEFREVAET